MASGLCRLQRNLSAKLIPCIRRSTFHSNSSVSGCRTVTSIAFNTGFAEESFQVDKNQTPVIQLHEAITLKEKEKGDWRNLTVEEKKALYHMSFSQCFVDIDQPADEWKIILACTFTAMGLMTLGMYIWMSQKVDSVELLSKPLSLQVELNEDEKMSLRRVE